MGYRFALGRFPALVLVLFTLMIGRAGPSTAQSLPEPTGELKAQIDFRHYLVYGTFPTPSPSTSPTPSPAPTRKPTPSPSTRDAVERDEMCCQRVLIESSPSPACLAALQLAGVQIYPNYDADQGLVVCANVRGLLEVSAACDGYSFWVGGCVTF